MIARPGHRTTVVLAEGSAPVARQLRRVLAQEFDVVAVVSDGLSLLRVVGQLQPDALVTELCLSGLDGLPAIETLCRQFPDLAVVVATVHTEAELVSRARAAGARGYVVKDDAGDDLLPALHAALAGTPFLSRRLTR